jgi:uncharacterized protein YndB with AHSA1/START domain
MIEFELTVEIRRPVDEVFAYVTDPETLSQWQTNTVEVEVLTEGPMRAGTRLREVHVAMGRRLEQVVEVSAYESNRRFDLRVVEGKFPLDGRNTFEATATGTTVRLVAMGHAPKGMRLLEPVLTRLARRQMRAHYSRLKTVLEGEPDPA